VNSRASAPPLVIALIALAAIFIVLLAMRATNAFLAPILLAFVLAVTTTPLLDWFIRKGAPSWLALILTILLIVIFILALVWLVGNSVQNFSESISKYQQRFVEIEQALGGFLTNLGVDVNNLGADQTTSPQGLLQLAASFVGGIVSGLSNFGLIILTTVFFLVEALAMPRKVQSVAQEISPGIRQFLQLNKELRQYMAINTVAGLLAAVINVILLLILGIEFAVLWGIFSFFLSFVPNVGFIISVIPPALMALLQYGPSEMLIVIVAYIVINFLSDNVIKPRFIEKGVNISMLHTFLALILWAWVLGPIGAILAVPMAIIVQAVLYSRPETRWLGYMMGSGSEPFNPGAEPDQDVTEQAAS
jgi:AI-2 transport protein TqsA